MSIEAKVKWLRLTILIFIVFLIFVYFLHSERNMAGSVSEEEFHAASNAQNLAKIMDLCIAKNKSIKECGAINEFLNKTRRKGASVLIFENKNFEFNINKSKGKFIYTKQGKEWKCTTEKIKLNFPECNKF